MLIYFWCVHVIVQFLTIFPLSTCYFLRVGNVSSRCCLDTVQSRSESLCDGFGVTKEASHVASLICILQFLAQIVDLFLSVMSQTFLHHRLQFFIPCWIFLFHLPFLIDKLACVVRDPCLLTDTLLKANRLLSCIQQDFLGFIPQFLGVLSSLTSPKASNRFSLLPHTQQPFPPSVPPDSDVVMQPVFFFLLSLIFNVATSKL